MRNKGVPFFFLLVLAAAITLACGGSNRQLQSITINGVTNGQQIQYTATGTFSASPTTVSPLPISWSFAPPPPQYTLTTQPFVFHCEVAGPYASPLIAMAPSDPNAPSSGSISTTKMISASAQILCP
jgi:hypothetical protein